MKDLFQNLNEEQIVAVKSEQHTLVVACPGSGKTRVLTHKVGYELQKLTSSKQRILALTHTNVAADEIADRIEQLDILNSQLWSGTIHAFCTEWILRPYSGYCEITKFGFTIADPEFFDEETKRLNNGKDLYGTLRFDILGNLIETDEKKKQIILCAYNNFRDQRYLTFDDILYQTYCLLRDNSFIADSLAKVFKWICVDEYQDTQELQYQILHLIIRGGEKKSKIFYVGDPNQLIYHGLGGIAKTEVQLTEELQCPVCKMTLQGNYRSSRRIINLYQNFQVQAELVPIEARGNYSELAGNIHYHRNVSLEYLPNFISEIVKSYVSNNILPEEICIIAPHWHFLANISRAVLGHLTDISLNAPGISPLPRNLDNFWLKVARLALTQPSPKLSRSRLRWANELLRDIVNGFKLPQEVQTGETLLQIINKISLFEDDGIKYLEIFFIEFEKLMKVPFSEINFFTEAKKQFLNAARKKRDDPKFESVPKNIAGFRKVFQPKQGVFLSSCHGIKGEEYEVVIAFGCLEDFIPHWQEKSNREVANRLLYVMASRAKQHLHFISETGHFDKSRNEKQPTQELVNLEFDFDKYY